MTRKISIVRPAKAALDPIWEFIYIAEALLGLLGSLQTFFFSFLQGIWSVIP